MHDRHELADWIRGHIATLLEVPAADVDPHASFTDLGVSSLQAMQLTGDLEVRLEAEVEPSVVYTHPTVELLATEIWSRHRS